MNDRGNASTSDVDRLGVNDQLDRTDELEIGLENGGRDDRVKEPLFGASIDGAAKPATSQNGAPTDEFHRAEADQLNNNGVSLARRGRIDEAIDLYLKALEIRPDFPEALNNLGIAHARRDRIDEAIACYESALRHRAEYPEALNNLGIARARKGDCPTAINHFEASLKLRDEYPEAHNNLANALRHEGKTEEAIAHYRRAIEIKPDYAEAANNLANALAEQNHLDQAVALYRDALRLNPQYAEAHNNLGNTLARQNKFSEAIACYRRALYHNPDYAEAYNNLGNATADEGRSAEAVACYRMALRLKPDYAEAHNNLGITLSKQGKGSESESCYIEALRLSPDYPDAHLNRALGWLQDGNFEQGWAEYDWRWRTRSVNCPRFNVPPWTGEPLNGKTVLLYYEQGLGDSLQFVRYAPLIKQRGGVIVFECQSQLIPLLSRCPGIDRLIPKGQPLPEFHVHCALLSLPRAMKTTLTNVPADIPYLYADPALVMEWREKLVDLDGFRIGINWQGNSQFKGDRHRSFPLEKFGPIAELPGVDLISLQKNLGTEQMPAFMEKYRLHDLGPSFDEVGGAFMDTAAAMMNLDLVISSDTAMVHLAGGLGVNTWTPLSWAADWRWMKVRSDSPWYPSLRLFRQPEPTDWDSVFQRMADDLRSMLNTTRRPQPIAVEIAAGELIDKITILEIKVERFTDETKLNHVQSELATLRSVYDQRLDPSANVEALTNNLREVNRKLWDIEEELRECEHREDFGFGFVELARSVYQYNDRRAALKRRLNEELDSRLIEEKSYDCRSVRNRELVGS